MTKHTEPLQYYNLRMIAISSLTGSAAAIKESTMEGKGSDAVVDTDKAKS